MDVYHGFEFLLSLYEAPYLKKNKGSLLSTDQTRETCIWLPDTLNRHVGQQILVAPVENSNEMVDLELKIKNDFLAITCSYPNDKDLDELPRV